MPIRITTADDLIDLAPRMREADVNEVRSLTGLDPLSVLSIGWVHSAQCMTGIGRDGDIVMIFGVVPSKETGAIWMLSSDGITRNAKELVREGRRWLDEQDALYPVLTNVVDVRNTVHRRLIKHMGFRFGEPINNYGKDKIQVIPFER